MKKLTILALHLGHGGIENCICMLANALCEQYDVEIVATYKIVDKIPFPLNDNIQIRYLIEDNIAYRVSNYKSKIFSFHWVTLVKDLYQDYLRKRKIKQLFQDTWHGLSMYHQRKVKMKSYLMSCQSDIIISTREIHNQLLGKFGRKEALKIGWEHNHPHGNQKYARKVIKSVEKLDYLVLVSEELKKFYDNRVKQCKCVFIPNAIARIPEIKASLLDKNIISVGRLSKEKGYEDLISVFKLVHERYPDWKLQIVGDGERRKKIEEKIKKYHLENFVYLHGFQNQDKIHLLYEKSSIYVMCSDTESFGLVLLEAFSYGIPCIAFNSAEGACTLISDNWDGYLIKDRNHEQMAKRICELIQNTNRRLIMGDNGYKKASQYQMDHVKEKWIAILK